MLIAAGAYGQAPPDAAAMRAMDALLAGEPNPRIDARDFTDVRSRYDCVTTLGVRVEHENVARDQAEVALVVHAAAEMRLSRAPREFPPNWIVCLHPEDGEWVADRVTSPERQLAIELERMPDRFARAAAIDRHPGLSPEELSRQICDVVDGGNGTWEHVTDLCESALSLAEMIGSHGSAARAIMRRGDAHIARSRFALARADLRKAIDLADGDPYVTVDATLGVAQADCYSGNVAAGIEQSNSALPMVRALGNDRLIAGALNQLGNCYFGPGNYREALKAYVESAQAAHRDQASALSEGNSLANAGIVYWMMNNDEEALDYLTRGIDLLRKVGDRPAVMRNLRNLAALEIHMGRYATAEKHLDECEHELRAGPNEPNVRTLGYLETSRADLALRRKQYELAEQHIPRALELSEKAREPKIAEIATCFRARVRLAQRRYDEALTDAHKSAEMCLTVSTNLDTYWWARLTAGRAYAALGRIREAETELRESIDAIEGFVIPTDAQNTQLFFQDKIDPYYELFRLLMRARPSAALDAIEQARARTLLSIVSQPKAVTDRSLTDAERQQEKTVDDELKTLNLALRDERMRAGRDEKKIDELQQQVAQKRLARAELTRTLYAHHPDLSVARGDIPRASLEQIQNMIPDDGAVLEYVVATDESWLVVITRHGAPRFIALHAGVDAWTASAKSFGSQIAQHDLEFRASSRKLYEQLIAPAMPLIRGKRLLCIIADGPLWEVPFQALASRDGRFLIERHDVFYAPSLSVLAWYADHRQPSGAAHQLLAFGNPRSGQLAPLPEAEEEVHAVASIYRRNATRLRTGRAATETQLKSEAGEFRILHLATHAVFDDTDPMYSYLALARAPDDADDGLLEAREIEQMSLHADLAVLSACDTGRGRVRGGEGVTGMSWALLAAGCPTAVVSRFAVASGSTRDLMIAFHRRLASADSSPRAATKALCDAQRALLHNQQRAHPFYWAAFMVFGRGW